MKKIIICMLALTLTVSLFTGCISKTEDLDTSANTGDLNEKELNIYTALEDDLIVDYLEGFKERYPDVKVNITRDSTGIITAKLLAEKDNPVADVVWGTAASSLLVLDSADLLEPYAPIGLERILPEFKDNGKVPKWVGIDAWETAFLVNKDVLASKGITEIPTSYAELVDPKYKGLIAMSNPASSGTGLLTVNGILSLMGEEEGWKYMDKLNDNVAVYLHSGSAPAKNTATGEYGIGVSFGYRCIKSAKDLGDKGAVVFPSEGSGWDVEANALIRKPEGVKGIALKFLDWAIEDDVMARYGESYPIIATGVGDKIPEGYTKNPMEQLIQGIDLNWCAENRDRILAEWTTRYDGKSAPKE